MKIKCDLPVDGFGNHGMGSGSVSDAKVKRIKSIGWTTGPAKLCFLKGVEEYTE